MPQVISTSIKLGLIALALSGCDQRKEIVVPPAEETGPKPSKLERPQPLELMEDPESPPATSIVVDKAKVWGSCQELFEPAGAPLTQLNFADQTSREEALYGCGVEATLTTADGHSFYAYAIETPTKGRAKNLRVVSYDRAGKLRWSHKMDRSAQGMSFIANLRSSFIAEVAPHLMCVGTTWEGSVQVDCLKDASAEVAWTGKLAFWAGIEPVGFDKNLVTADVTGLKRIYPWSGVEREFKRFGGSGGRASLYATDGEKLYFASNRSAPVELVAYDFATFEPTWIKTLEKQVDPMWSAVYPEHKLLVIHQGEHLLGIDTATGDALWSAHVANDLPQITRCGDDLYVLVRRPKGPNLIHVLDPRTGARKWWGAPPTGTLRVHCAGDQLLLGSVRAIQRARPEK